MSVDGQTISSVTVNGTTWTIADDTLTALAEGTYDIVVTATDAAGNVGKDESSDELVIDLTGPQLTTVALQSDNAKDASLAKAGDTITLSFVSDVDLGQTPTVTIDGQSTSVSTVGSRDTNLRARTEGGFNLNLVNGMQIQASGFYDGFGAKDYASYGGTVTFTIPLSW